jgi:hypothetical protein
MSGLQNYLLNQSLQNSSANMIDPNCARDDVVTKLNLVQGRPACKQVVGTTGTKENGNLSPSNICSELFE